jgi:hypothetical protein
MARYVIDENVFENAITNKKYDGSPAHSEREFADKFFRGTDVMFINKKIRDKFLEKLPKKIHAKYKPEFIDNTIIPSLRNIVFNSSRTNIIEGIKTPFKGVKDCDVEFVGVTLQSQAILVTSDEKLKSSMSEDELVSKCKCATVEECLNQFENKL